MSAEGLAHLAGDYVVQSHWAAVEKTRAAGPAAVHALTYTACFLPVTRSLRALAVIGGTHYLIDRYRLARHVVWAKNQLAPRSARYPRSHADGTGYHAPGPGHSVPLGTSVLHRVGPHEGCEAVGPPSWLATPLLIAADNTLHLIINRWAVRRWSRS